MESSMPQRYFLAFITVLVTSIIAAPSHAQSSKSVEQKSPVISRAQIKMERDEFLRTHRWSASEESWVMKPEYEAPAGVKTRAQVKAEQLEFLKNNRWDDVTGTWTPIRPGPRSLDALSREEVRRETRQFLKTHEWDPVQEAWVLKQATRQKRS
jgi:hypothetical protein